MFAQSSDDRRNGSIKISRGSKGAADDMMHVTTLEVICHGRVGDPLGPEIPSNHSMHQWVAPGGSR